MTNRRKLIVTVAAAPILAIGVALLTGRSTSPRYHDRPLSEWLPLLPSPPLELSTTNEAVTAVRAIGTNALPELLSMLQKEDSAFRKCFIWISRNQSIIKLNVKPAKELAGEARDGLLCLGKAGAPAIPELIRLLQNPRLASDAAEVLSLQGREGFRALTNGLASPDGVVRWCSVAHLSLPGTRETNAVSDPTILEFQRDAVVAVPALIVALHDNNPKIAYAAAMALGDIRQNQEIVVPALLSVINDPNASEQAKKGARRALDSFGSDPALSQ